MARLLILGLKEKGNLYLSRIPSNMLNCRINIFDFRKADQQADIYSLGKILFEAITEKIGQETTPFKTVGLPNTETPFFEKLDRVIQDARAENREDRLASVAQLRTAVLDAIGAFKKEPVTGISPESKRFPYLHNPKGFGLIDSRGHYVTDNRNVKEVKLYDPDKKELELAPLKFDSIEKIFATYDSKNSQWPYSKVRQFESRFNTEIMEPITPGIYWLKVKTTDIYKDPNLFDALDCQ
jgi:hypothetical protein